jgi:hypothetical protein
LPEEITEPSFGRIEHEQVNMIALCVERMEFDVMANADFFEDRLQAIEMRRIQDLAAPLGRKDAAWS